ncbi:sulfatase [Paraglaciecola sp.]|uniref:sulfatase n=1 Tax=Paraglaciecola sp. TaxID=1920173 RepID=UPI003EF34903
MQRIILSVATALLISCTGENSSQDKQQSVENNIQSSSSAKKPHILFISIDDFRPELASYNSGIAVTPNIDEIAHNGVRFLNAHAQQAICGPSRASTMTGLRPDTLGVTHNYVKFRHKLKDVKTIPQHFMDNGYVATHVGKIFHHGDKDADVSWNYPAAYDKISHIKKPSRYALQSNMDLQTKQRKEMFAKYGEQAKFGLGSGPAFEKAEVADTAYEDGYNTELAIATLKELLAKKDDKPIFFGFGMNKPHLPWVAPKKYWDLYDPAQIELSAQTEGPKGGAAMGLHASFEMRTFSNVPNAGPIPDDLAVELKHSYLASVSYIDAQIGKIMQAFEEAGVLDNTIVMLWSDHGYHLGEMGIWGKASNYDIATRVPLILSTPDMTKSQKGSVSEALVELVDMYPTLSELAGLDVPSHLEGLSLVPLLTQPDLPWKQAAFSQFPSPALREWGAFPLRKGMRETYFGPLIENVESRIQNQQGDKWDRELFEHHLMGYSMRTQQHRLVAWKDTRDVTKVPLFVELFDHHTDPNETVNIAAQHPKVVANLLQQLNAGWNNNKVQLN